MRIFAEEVDNFILLSSIVFYAFFIVSVIVSKLAARRSYYMVFFRRFLVFGIVYFIFTLFAVTVYFELSALNLVKILIGLILYALYHYGFIGPLIGITKKSVSVNLLATLYKENGTLSISKLKELHAENKGLDFVTKDRIEQLIASKLIKPVNGLYSITKRGYFLLNLIHTILKIWGVKRVMSVVNEHLEAKL